MGEEGGAESECTGLRKSIEECARKVDAIGESVAGREEALQQTVQQALHLALEQMDVRLLRLLRLGHGGGVAAEWGSCCGDEEECRDGCIQPYDDDGAVVGKGTTCVCV